MARTGWNPTKVGPHPPGGAPATPTERGEEGRKDKETMAK